MLLPSSSHDFMPKRHLAWLVAKGVEKSETASIEEKYSELGQNTNHLKILIKLLFYGYAVGERRGLVIARRCEIDTAYMYLSQTYRPDFKTINDFKKSGEVSGICLIFSQEMNCLCR